MKVEALSKDKEIVGLADAFLSAYLQSAKSDKSLVDIINHGAFSIFPGGAVAITPEITTALDALTLKISTSLPPNIVDEKSIKSQAMTVAQAVYLGNFVESLGAISIIQEITKHAQKQFKFLAPTYLLKFRDGISSVRIGPVRVVKIEQFAAEFVSSAPDASTVFVQGGDFQVSFTSKSLVVSSTAISWVIDVPAAEANVETEAQWLAGIAISYLRMHITIETQGSYPPTLGAVEPKPFERTALDIVGAKIDGPIVKAGGKSLPPWYEIGTELATLTQSANFTKKAQLIFHPAPKSLASRVSQGLGWLTRGRQSEDRSERLLYFFTALEALLSNSDKTAPVTQTIARHAAVILTNDVKERAKIAKIIKDLYSLRSALVHAGSRGVIATAASQIQLYAEAVFHEVIHKTTLEGAHDTFNACLADASHGDAWQPEQPTQPSNT